MLKYRNRDDNIYRAIFETDPYPDYKRQLGTGGNPIKFKKYEGLKPNIIFVMIDDLGHYNVNMTGTHNPEMHTPNFDKFVGFEEFVDLRKYA